jgi:hypothetical protein
MILYHFADTSHSELLPSVGSRRHEAEDPRAVGKAVVWLTDSPARAPSVENNARFRHEVEVDENDPCLFKDGPTEQLKNGWQSIFPSKADAVRGMETLYFYTKSINVISVVPVNNA